MFKKYKKLIIEKSKNPPLKFPSSEKKSFGIIENMIASFIFFSPNFLMYMPFFKDKIFLFIMYNYFIIFLLTSIISNIKYR